jgi:hypothetical protein
MDPSAGATIAARLQGSCSLFAAPCGDTPRRFAKAARNHRTGLKLTISGPFFIGTLVGVGCRVMVLGPRLGTLVGTLEPMPMCALRAHVVVRRSQ